MVEACLVRFEPIILLTVSAQGNQQPWSDLGPFPELASVSSLVGGRVSALRLVFAAGPSTKLFRNLQRGEGRGDCLESR